MTYSDKLQDPRWQRKRLEIFERDGFTCLECQSQTEQLHVHHRYYISGREPWEYPGFCYQTLCKRCHGFQKERAQERRMMGASLFEDWEFALDHFGGRLFDLAAREIVEGVKL